MDCLKTFLDDYGPSLAQRVNDELEVIHDPLNDKTEGMDGVLDKMDKKPFPVQRQIIKGAVKSFNLGNKSVYITAEMGSGKTIMGIATALLLKENPRVLVLCPPHLVRKWIKEIKDSVPLATVYNINGQGCLSFLEGLRNRRPGITPEFYVIGRERAKTTFQWRPAAVKNRLGMSCPKCGKVLVDNDGVPLPIFQRNTQGKYMKKYQCPNMVPKWLWDQETGKHNKRLRICGESLWQPDLNSRKSRKYMPAMFIKNKLKNFFDLLIADEIHQRGYALDSTCHNM